LLVWYAFLFRRSGARISRARSKDITVLVLLSFHLYSPKQLPYCCFLFYYFFQYVKERLPQTPKGAFYCLSLPLLGGRGACGE